MLISMMAKSLLIQEVSNFIVHAYALHMKGGHGGRRRLRRRYGGGAKQILAAMMTINTIIRKNL